MDSKRRCFLTISLKWWGCDSLTSGCPTVHRTTSTSFNSTLKIQLLVGWPCLCFLCTDHDSSFCTSLTNCRGSRKPHHITPKQFMHMVTNFPLMFEVLEMWGSYADAHRHLFIFNYLSGAQE